MLPLICAVASGLTNIVVAYSIKGAQNEKCRISLFGSIATGIAFLLSIAFLPLFSGKYSILEVWIIGVVLGGLFCTSISLGAVANYLGPPSIAWSMANMGLLVPIAMASLFLGEALYLPDIILFLAFVLMLLVFHQGTAKANDIRIVRPFLFAILMLSVFLSNGLLMFCFKLNQNNCPDANKACLLVSMYGSACLFFSIAAIISGRKNGGDGCTRKSIIPEAKWGIILGFAICITQITLQGAMSLPAIVTFPVVQGLSLIGGITVLSYIYKENFNLQKIAGVVLGLIIVLLSVIR